MEVNLLSRYEEYVFPEAYVLQQRWLRNNENVVKELRSCKNRFQVELGIF